MLSCLDMRRLVALFLVLAVPISAQLRETMTVARILLDVRVTDIDGEAMIGLEAQDFEVRIDGQKAEVLSATWIDDTAGFEAPPPPDTPAAGQPDSSRLTTVAPAGRLFIFFIQTDFSRETERVRGQMHFLLYAEKTLEMLEPEDRVAVFSFDSHLKFRLDFTSDKEKILAAKIGRAHV